MDFPPGTNLMLDMMHDAAPPNAKKFVFGEQDPGRNYSGTPCIVDPLTEQGKSGRNIKFYSLIHSKPMRFFMSIKILKLLISKPLISKPIGASDKSLEARFDYDESDEKTGRKIRSKATLIEKNCVSTMRDVFHTLPPCETRENESIEACGLKMFCLNRNKETSYFKTPSMRLQCSGQHLCRCKTPIHSLCAHAMNSAINSVVSTPVDETTCHCLIEVEEIMLANSHAISGFDKVNGRWLCEKLSDDMQSFIGVPKEGVVSKKRKENPAPASVLSGHQESDNSDGSYSIGASEISEDSDSYCDVEEPKAVETEIQNRTSKKKRKKDQKNLPLNGYKKYEATYDAQRLPQDLTMRPHMRWSNPNANSKREISDYFDAFFLPAEVLDQITNYTSDRLKKKMLQPVRVAEFKTYLGYLLLLRLWGTDSKSELWSESSFYNLSSIKPANIGQYGMTLNRFDDITHCLAFIPMSLDPNPNESAAPFNSLHTLKELGGVIEGFNEQRRNNFEPGATIVVDEGEWTSNGVHRSHSHGLTHIIKGKPVQDDLMFEMACDCKTKICLALELQFSDRVDCLEFDGVNVNQETALTLRLCKGFFGSRRTIYGDSKISSVETALSLREKGLFFMGLVKTSNPQFIKDFLRNFEYDFHGQSVHYMKEFATEKGSYPILATGWNDGRIQTIVSSCGKANLEGEPKTKREKESKARKSTPASAPIPRDAITAEYHSNCNGVDVHNHHRQRTLALEDRIKTRCWRFRGFCSIFGIAITDAYLAHSYFHPEGSHQSIKFFAAALMAKFLKIETVDEPIINISTDHRFDSVLKLSIRLEGDQKPKEKIRKNGVKELKLAIRCQNDECLTAIRLKAENNPKAARPHAYKHCVRCTEFNFKESGDAKLKRSHIHALCKECEHDHLIRRKSADSN